MFMGRTQNGEREIEMATEIRKIVFEDFVNEGTGTGKVLRVDDCAECADGVTCETCERRFGRGEIFIRTTGEMEYVIDECPGCFLADSEIGSIAIEGSTTES
jgi:hypothetical protein